MPKLDFLKNLFSSGASKLVESVGTAIDETVTNSEEKMELKRQMQQQIETFVENTTNAAAGVVTTEANGNWLQRSWRPIVMLSFAFIVVYQYFLAPVFNLTRIELPGQFWDLLEIGLGGYVVGRSVEKVVSNITDKMDIVPNKLKRK